MSAQAIKDTEVLRETRSQAPAQAREAKAPESETRLEVRRDPPPPQTPETHDKQEGGSGGEGRPRSRRFAGIGLGALIVAIVAASGYLYWDDSSHYVSTDDAFIAARQYSVSPKVGGNIVAIPLTDNQHVVAGDVIARVDDRDYRAALAQTVAQIQSAQAAIQSADAQTVAQQAQIDQYSANVDQAPANLTFAQQQASRYDTLAKDGAGSEQNAQQYSSQLRQQQAALKSAEATLAASKQQLGVIKAQHASAEASLAQANAQHEQAELNLSYTIVTATQSGRIVQLSASLGQLAQAGAGLAILVPDEIWVEANFKETQLIDMKPGQPFDLEIDAFPGRKLRGHVDSVQPGSGTAFSLLPAENATGNYVKIVQRVPVKLVLDSPPADLPLGPGMSVVPTVRVNPEPSLYERLRAKL
jgi:membrane fusion protein, multidrug efflux system